MMSTQPQQAAQLMDTLTGPSLNKFLKEECIVVARIVGRDVIMFMMQGKVRFVDRHQCRQHFDDDHFSIFPQSKLAPDVSSPALNMCGGDPIVVFHNWKRTAQRHPGSAKWR